MPKPNDSDFPPFYQGYVRQVNEENVLNLLKSQCGKTKGLYFGLTDAQGNHAYAPGKWTMKEVLGHIIDAERVFGYRALCMARGETQALPGMDQETYMAAVNFNNRTIQSLIDEYDSVRQATMLLFTNLTDKDLQKTGIASNGRFTVNALLHIIAGHELHHMAILQARYF